MKKILSLALFAVVLVSCNQDIKTNTPAFQAKINDANWRANDARVSLGENNGIVITAFTAYEELVLETSSTNPGTYVLGTTNQNNFASYYFNSEGIEAYYDTDTYYGPAYKIASILNGGADYSNTTGALTQSYTGTGSGMKLSIQTDATGKVTSAVIVARGDGYKAGDIVTILGGNGSARVRILNVQQSNGEIVIESFENGTFTGTFKLNAANEDGEMITFSEGNFYKVPVY
ncbi:DUF6252 family protein [Flavobacterium sp. NRK F10]|uniref:DUF6252 family protein n=1 Tax=Flavobacterium sp. NRK F10 TaxID=2954931 RepID=UPI0020902031|nr:DUF6252 family protein [Flavobacterium sp. NRK F10]MCO6175053.1 DUF6252 family protein [Flavobacterium sp. NRK F10]